MKRIKLTVAYDGTCYSGWQLQPNAVTVEKILNDAISQLIGQETRVTGASRTDAGVHSLGNVAVFDTDSQIPAEKFAYALNSRLPQDIVIQHSEEVDAGYHPRRQNTIKIYEYKILNRTFPLPLMRKDTLFYHYPLDIDAMNEAAQYLVGEHDFKSFCSVHTQAETTVRRIYSVDVLARPVANDIAGSEIHDMGMNQGRLITIRVCGNGFLYNMVRIIAGTLIEAGNGQRTPESVYAGLLACDRKFAGPTAPPQGLTLVRIEEMRNGIVSENMENGSK